MSAAPSTPPPAGGPRPRRALRLAAVLVALAAPVALVIGAARLDDGLQQQRAQVARAEAVSAVLQQGAAARTVRPVLDDVVADLRAGDPGEPATTALVRAAGADALGSAAGRAALATAVADAADRLDERLDDRHRLSAAVVVGLFVAMGAGWAAWVVGLVRRRRAVQAELTRREVQAAGERRLQALVRSSTDVIAVLDDDSTVTFISPAVSTVLGRDADRVVGRRFTGLVVADDRRFLARTLARDLDRPDQVEQTISLQLPHPDGRLLTLEGTLEDLRHDPVVAGWVLTARDVSERHALEGDLAHRVLHDSLTGLANRQLLAERLAHALRRRDDGRGRAPLAVLVVDLDDFKVVNDSHGHAVGDRLLVEVARRMVAGLHPGDTVARLGGDEFAVLLEAADLDEATAVAEDLLAALAQPVELDGTSYGVQASIGLAVLPAGAEPDPQLLRKADVARYEAKDRGKGGVVVHDDRMHLRVLEELRLRVELAEAISGGQLVLHHQPIVSLQTQTITGFEALVRWCHPARGLVPPLDFIGLAETSGLIVPLGEWVLREACRAAATMQHADGGPTISVNVAPLQLTHPDFRASVLEALAESGLPPHRLVLEITEGALLGDASPGVAVLGELRRLGVRVAIDDFGTGYNSLARLSALPLDVLKIDKSFVDRLGAGEADSTLVEAVVAMAEALGLVVVAEGVEHAEQAAWLRGHRVALGQGYLWSRPVPLPAATELLREGVPVVLEHPPAPHAGRPGLAAGPREDSRPQHG